MNHIADYAELSSYMDKLGLFHMDLSLGRMEAFWARRTMPKMPIIHVVGTNGKGSTAAFVCSLARAHGRKTGLFTSPHFVSPRERVQVNRAMLSEEMWVELANDILSSPEGEALTYFEFQTCLAMLAFERENVDLAVMEAGLGGRWDATNVFAPYMTLFTPIGLDHEAILGPTIHAIATDKAGAIHPGGVVITGVQVPEAMIPLQDRSALVHARFVHAVDVADTVYGVKLGLPGIHQTANARLALAGWRWFAAEHGLKSEVELERFGLEYVFLPGRMQHIELNGQEMILDGAHNVPALEALNAALDGADIKPGSMIFSCLRDKNITAMLPLVRTLTDGPVFVPPLHNERAGDNLSLAERIGPAARPVDSLAEALDASGQGAGPVLMCGSLYLLAEFYTLHGEYLTPKG
ncbi:bifunctional folylpolyglutamate synthase/dihydrofolate synthase [Pseudodesulfovibrio sp.]|uniref:bifunctional folylpolyglutamate synthase/dihydrofolate synthase n=1 Tax=unclassified Pseudodesulfovibrio TaxID=2661612 RepID=UPI003B004D02